MSASRTGSSLATALVVLAVLLTLGFTAAGLSTSNLNLTSRSIQAQTARNLAEAAIAQGVAELTRRPAFGTAAAGPGQQTIVTGFPSAPGGEGVLTFDRAEAERRRIPYSSNNLLSDSSIPGWEDTVLPGQSVHLIGTGRAGGLEHRVEAVLFISRFPYAVASSGPIRSHGGLVISALDSAAPLAQGADKVPAAEQKPGALASNSRNRRPQEAVKLAGVGVNVTGDVQAAGDIEVAPQVAVGGEVRSGADPVALPRIEITQFDTAGKPDVLNLPDQSYPELLVQGYVRSDKPLFVGQGLSLDGGVLYVDGNLDVDGGISGTGAVIVNGATNVTGTSGRADPAAKAALLSKGSVRLRGDAQQYQGFQGLVYTEGDLSSRYLDLAGVFVANNPEASTVTLDDTRVFQLPMDVLGFTVKPPAQPPTPPPAGTPPGGTDSSGPPPAVVPILGVGVPSLKDASKSVIPVLIPAKLPRAADGRYRKPATKEELFASGALAWQVWGWGGHESTLTASWNCSEINYLLQNPPLDQYALNLIRQACWDHDLRSIVAQLNAQTPQPSPQASTQASPSATASPSPATADGEQWTVDFSRFMQVQDRMRILLWRDL